MAFVFTGFLGFYTHISGELVRLCIPLGPEDWLPFVDEVVCMGHTMLNRREGGMKLFQGEKMPTVSGTPFSCVIENCPLCVRM